MVEPHWLDLFPKTPLALESRPWNVPARGNEVGPNNYSSVSVRFHAALVSCFLVATTLLDAG
jgi:hypothetical protein